MSSWCSRRLGFKMVSIWRSRSEADVVGVHHGRRMWAPGYALCIHRSAHTDAAKGYC